MARASRIPVSIGLQIADNLHPVGNPAVDTDGNIYVTFSGPRGQPRSGFAVQDHARTTASSRSSPRWSIRRDWRSIAGAILFVSCRNDGTIHRVTPDGRAEQWIEGMGIATGIAFDRRRESVRRRPQRHNFQDQPEPRNFRVRDTWNRRSRRIIWRFIRAAICT